VVARAREVPGALRRARRCRYVDHELLCRVCRAETICAAICATEGAVTGLVALLRSPDEGIRGMTAGAICSLAENGARSVIESRIVLLYVPW
jgi:hypothetical protein